MKIRFLLACLIGSSLVATPMAFSANLNAMKVTKYKTYNHNIWLYSLNGDVQQNVSGYKYDDFLGAEIISLNATSYNQVNGEYWSISCDYPADKAVVSINKVNGKNWILSLKATLDPADPRCGSYNVATPVVIDLSGNANDVYHGSSSGQGKSTHLGNSWKYSYQSEEFSADLAGTVNSMSATLSGYATVSRNSNLQKIIK